jgi:hypothetical protein
VTSGLAHPRAGRVRTGVGWDSRWWSPASRSSVSAPLIAGNEDGIKHCAMNVLHSLQHIGCAIPPQADAGWIGEAGPGPSYLDPGSGGPESDFTGNQRREWDAGSRFDFENPRVPLTPAVHAGWVSGPSADG